MICLLCYESTNDFISVDEHQGRQLRVSTLLFKYFRFCFDIEPLEGDLCTKCWQKTIAFHEFYEQIESVHEVISKTKDILDLEHEPVKIELNEPSLKCDQTFGENTWFQCTDDASQSSFGASPKKLNASTGTARIGLNETNLKRTFDERIWFNSDPEDASSRSSIDSPAKSNANASMVKTTKCDMTKKQSKKSTKSISRKSRKTSRGRPKNPVMFTCKIRMCMEEFESMDALISHKTTAHRRIQCTHCPDLKLVVDLNKHLRNTHGIMQNSMCEHCGQVYMNTRSLQDHIQRKHEVSEPLQCDICKEWFKSRDTIRAHMNYVHVQGPQACPICGKISANRKALRKHQTIHLEAWKDRFKCIICGRGFRDSTKLKEHSYIHSGVTDAYFCQFCGQSFRFGSSLSAHRMRYHPAEMAHVKDRLQRKKNLEFKV